jgi:hypothetical protein
MAKAYVTTTLAGDGAAVGDSLLAPQVLPTAVTGSTHVSNIDTLYHLCNVKETVPDLGSAPNESVTTREMGRTRRDQSLKTHI